jgi:hypothetical protein
MAGPILPRGCPLLPYQSPNTAAVFIDRSSRIWNFAQDRVMMRCHLLHGKGEAMRKSLAALAAVAALAVSVVAAPAPAHAQRGVAAGVAAGVVGGAIIGGAIASQNYYYGPGYYGPGYYGPGYYYPPQSYYYNGAPAYAADPAGPCYWQRQRFWDGFGWRFRSVRVCG